MGLAKATFYTLEKSSDPKKPDEQKNEFKVNFNPKELTLERSHTFSQAENKSDASELQHKGGDNLTLGMTLYFDTYEDGTSVRTVYMSKLEGFMKVKVDPPKPAGTPAPGDTKKPDPPPATSPPSVLFVWGRFRFRGVITSLSQKYTMFLSDGTPVRAEATLSMTQSELTPAEMAQADPLEGPAEPTAADALSKGAAGLDPKSKTALANDPLGTLASSKSAVAESATKSGVSAFMDSHGKQMVESALVGYISGGKKGAFDGVLKSAGNTQMFGTSTGGKALNTLASGKELDLASVSGGYAGSAGSIGGGVNIGLKRDGSKLSLGVSDGAAVQTSSGKSIYGVQNNATVSSDGNSASNTRQVSASAAQARRDLRRERNLPRFSIRRSLLRARRPHRRVRREATVRREAPAPPELPRRAQAAAHVRAEAPVRPPAPARPVTALAPAARGLRRARARPAAAAA